MQLRDILDVLAALEREGVRYAVFGGLAMAAHGLDRGTRDLDLFVDPSPENVARLRAALRSVYDDPDIAEITADDLGGDYPAIQYGPPGVDFTIDLVARLGDEYTYDDLEVERVRAGEQEIAVVNVRTLYAMKANTVRPRDADDAARLRRRFGDAVEG
ncbi:nucleotidyl transferase AbiEii/AbiGii toxin family protein [Euzebya sp.]|uniref:nucleotidyl transferase AbiEii/AbiGii toxin family protein n=1 Tax=Euzebya sp. TaxID=1971409 RepID=UPI003519CE55